MYFRKVIAIALTIIVFICHIIPGNKITLFQWESLLAIDKVFHFFIFGVLSVSYLIYFYNVFSKNRYVFYTICIVFAYGVFLESLQGMFFLSRDFDILDLLADIIGSFIFVFCFVKLKLNKYFNLD